jgi:hypothetical protein
MTTSRTCKVGNERDEGHETIDGVHADEGGQVAWDRLEDYLVTLA